MITIDRTPAGLLLTPSGAAPVLIADAAILGPRPGDRRADVGHARRPGPHRGATPRPTRRPTGRALRRRPIARNTMSTSPDLTTQRQLLDRLVLDRLVTVAPLPGPAAGRRRCAGPARGVRPSRRPPDLVMARPITSPAVRPVRARGPR